jgi:glutamate N-acetyltransferase / amino-acid N-acetyltransferase
MISWNLASGYSYAGVHCGIRPDPNRLDLALVISDGPATAAGVFTQNQVVAAPFQVCRQRLPCSDARGIVICSGNANACTGQRGLEDARAMARIAAGAISCRPEQILVCSTGVIGRHLPMPCIETGIRAAALSLESAPAGLDRAARAILTTDKRVKVSTRVLTIGGSKVQITGFAKGAAMIGPNLATMLAFVLTDAKVLPDELSVLTHKAVDKSFNCISVEGHTSTNDTVLFFANGQGPQLEGEGLTRFQRAACDVCMDLAQAIADDAEGANHFITIMVEGARDDTEARRIAKTVAESVLVKTAIFGADPNWGRIVSAAGYAGVPFKEEHLSLWLDETLLYHNGAPQPFNAAAASAYLKHNRNIQLRLRFSLGSGQATFWTCDLGYEYIRLNAEYTT